MCYVQLGDRATAASFILEETLAAAEADGEMAYRLATYFAVDGDESEALHWLRRAIYLGNENYPWFTKNPAWRRLSRPHRLRAHPRRPQKILPPQPEQLEAPPRTAPRLARLLSFRSEAKESVFARAKIASAPASIHSSVANEAHCAHLRIDRRG